MHQIIQIDWSTSIIGKLSTLKNSDPSKMSVVQKLFNGAAILE